MAALSCLDVGTDLDRCRAHEATRFAMVCASSRRSARAAPSSRDGQQDFAGSKPGEDRPMQSAAPRRKRRTMTRSSISRPARGARRFSYTTLVAPLDPAQMGTTLPPPAAWINSLLTRRQRHAHPKDQRSSVPVIPKLLFRHPGAGQSPKNSRD